MLHLQLYKIVSRCLNVLIWYSGEHMELCYSSTVYVHKVCFTGAGMDQTGTNNAVQLYIHDIFMIIIIDPVTFEHF